MNEIEENIHEQMMRESDEEEKALEQFYDEHLRNPKNAQEFKTWQDFQKY